MAVKRPNSANQRRQAAIEKKRKEEERVKLSMAMSIRIANNYGNDPQANMNKAKPIVRKS